MLSDKILGEVYRVHTEKLPRPWPKKLAAYWQEEVRASFPEALVENYEPLIPILTNDEGDRHVLAAAIRGQAQLIVTFNLKHFKAEALRPWDLFAVHPQEYLITLYEMAPEVVVAKLHAIARDREKEPQDCLSDLRDSVPLFVDDVAASMDWEV